MHNFCVSPSLNISNMFGFDDSHVFYKAKNLFACRQCHYQDSITHNIPNRSLWSGFLWFSPNLRSWTRFWRLMSYLTIHKTIFFIAPEPAFGPERYWAAVHWLSCQVCNLLYCQFCGAGFLKAELEVCSAHLLIQSVTDNYFQGLAHRVH